MERKRKSCDNDKFKDWLVDKIVGEKNEGGLLEEKIK